MSGKVRATAINDRNFNTVAGSIQKLKVPRDRAGEFHTQVFERYECNDESVTAAIARMFFSGISQAKIGKITEPLMGVHPKSQAQMTMFKVKTKYSGEMPIRAKSSEQISQLHGARIYNIGIVRAIPIPSILHFVTHLLRLYIGRFRRNVAYKNRVFRVFRTVYSPQHYCLS